MEIQNCIKCILIGDSRVGKTSIFQRFINNNFDYQIPITIGVDFSAKFVNLNNKLFKIQIWDTAGHERFNSIIRLYYRDADICIIVFDLNNKISFDNAINKWYNEFIEQNTWHYKIVLIGNKSDENKYKREVNKYEIDEWINEKKILYFETSALSGYNVNEIFENITFDIDKIETEKLEKVSILKKKSKFNCC